MRLGLFLASRPTDGGAFQYARTLVTDLARMGDVRVHAVVTHPAWVPYLEEAGIDHSQHDYPAASTAYDRIARNLGWSPRAWWPIASMTPLGRVMQSLRSDAWWFPAQDGFSYQLPVRSIVSVFDLMHRTESFPEITSRGRGRRRDRHYRNVAAHASAIVVDAELGKQQFLTHYRTPSSRVHVLTPAPPPHVQRAAEHDEGPNAVLASLPRRFFFYPAQFWTHKNHHTLLDALTLASRHDPDMHLVLCGEPKNAFSAVQDQIHRLGLAGRVTCLGFVSDEQMVALYRGAVALVMPTFFGPTNIPPVEAMALGCPVACSDVYAMPEQVGDAALLFDPRDASAMAGAMTRLWRDGALRSRLRYFGLERARRLTGSVRMGVIESILHTALEQAGTR